MCLSVCLYVNLIFVDQVNHSIWVLRIKLRSSTRATLTLITEPWLETPEQLPKLILCASCLILLHTHTGTHTHMPTHTLTHTAIHINKLNFILFSIYLNEFKIQYISWVKIKAFNLQFALSHTLFLIIFES